MLTEDHTPQFTQRTMRAPAVATKLGIGEATIWRWAQAGHFPKPTRLSPGVTVWFETEVDAWLAAKAAAAEHAA